MRTEIFIDYAEFLNREDKSVNGVSSLFAANNIDYAADNESNVGCWNCSDCSYCHDCSHRED